MADYESNGFAETEKLVVTFSLQLSMACKVLCFMILILLKSCNGLADGFWLKYTCFLSYAWILRSMMMFMMFLVGVLAKFQNQWLYVSSETIFWRFELSNQSKSQDPSGCSASFDESFAFEWYAIILQNEREMLFYFKPS